MGVCGGVALLAAWGAVMERLVPFEGQITPCSCGKQPRHLHRLGKDIHAIDCPPCGVRTGFYPSVQQALEEWEVSRNVVVKESA